jgi:hypothetical protein
VCPRRRVALASKRAFQRVISLQFVGFVCFRAFAAGEK